MVVSAEEQLSQARLALIDFAEDDDARKLGFWVVGYARLEEKDAHVIASFRWHILVRFDDEHVVRGVAHCVCAICQTVLRLVVLVVHDLTRDVAL